jgi:hypothetical protein
LLHNKWGISYYQLLQKDYDKLCYN